MSWRKIPMKFPGTCIVCNEKIEVNEIGLWAKGLGVKHEKCAQINELQCIVCGASAGCHNVSFKKIVISQMSLNYVFARNVVRKRLHLLLIKNQQTRNFHFLTLEILK